MRRGDGFRRLRWSAVVRRTIRSRRSVGWVLWTLVFRAPWPRSRSEADTLCRFANRPRTSTYPATATCRGIKAPRTIYSLNGGNVPRRKRFAETMADEEMQATLVAGGQAQSTQPGERAKLPVERGPRRQAGGRWGSTGTDEERTADRVLRSRPSLRPCQRCAAPTARSRPAATRSGTAKTVPTMLRSSAGVPEGCRFVRQRLPRTRQLCGICRTAIALARWRGSSRTTIGTYLFQTETIRYREISYQDRQHDGHLWPHCCHRAVAHVVSVVIRSQRRELRDACAVYRSLPGWKPYADFRHRAGRGLLSGDGFMRTYFWQDGRVLGFDAVEWLAWIAALNVLALITLVI